MNNGDILLGYFTIMISLFLWRLRNRKFITFAYAKLHKHTFDGLDIVSDTFFLSVLWPIQLIWVIVTPILPIINFILKHFYQLILINTYKSIVYILLPPEEKAVESVQNPTNTTTFPVQSNLQYSTVSDISDKDNVVYVNAIGLFCLSNSYANVTLTTKKLNVDYLSISWGSNNLGYLTYKKYKGLEAISHFFSLPLADVMRIFTNAPNKDNLSYIENALYNFINNNQKNPELSRLYLLTSTIGHFRSGNYEIASEYKDKKIKIDLSMCLDICAYSRMEDC